MARVRDGSGSPEDDSLEPEEEQGDTLDAAHVRLPDRDLRVLITGSQTYVAAPLPESGAVRIGRGGDAEVRVTDPSISRLHAALHVNRAGSALQLTIEDLGSSNGTTVRGKRLEPNERCSIAVGEAVDLGLTTMIVQRSASTGRPRRLWSHGDFEARLEEECERARESGATFALIRVRADRKAPAAGIEETLAGIVRPYDLLAVYAPGEYELLVLDAPAARLDPMLSEMRARLSERRTPVRIGVASFPSEGRRPEELMARAAARLEGREVSEREPDRVDPGMVVVGHGAMEGLYRLVDRVAPSDISVLLLGETGVGKEVMATAIHQRSKRAEHPLLRLNCAALSETLLESELFGHEKGSFTGAMQSKPGLLETADGGTVFLDEIGELPLQTQVKLLRVLEDRQVMRVGALRAKPIDVRFVSATNRDLEEEIERGGFRRDLYYRLNGIALEIPPLRERVGEIEPLARAFAAKAHEKNGFPGEPGISREAIALLKRYRWPGNIRELRNVIERAVLLAGGETIQREHLPVERLTAALVSPPPRRRSSISAGVGALHDASALHSRDALAEVTFDSDEETAREMRETLPPPKGATRGPPDEELQRIQDALDQCGGNQTRAAEMLGISRRTLISRLDAYGVARPRKNQPDRGPKRPGSR